jgi:hypothetical protein
VLAKGPDAVAVEQGSKTWIFVQEAIEFLSAQSGERAQALCGVHPPS